MFFSQALAMSLLFFPPADAPSADMAKAQRREWFLAARIQFLDALAGKKSVRSECVDMLDAILKGSMMGPGDGWFKASQSKYTWQWLAERCGVGDEKSISRDQFKGSDALFERLDRDGDGAITPDDFDWSPKSAYVRQMGLIGPWFGRSDLNSNGRLSKAEWEEIFNKASAGKNHLTPEDLRRMLFPPPPPPIPDALKALMMPSKEMMMKALAQGELGSPFEGPRVGKRAPLFTLPLHDGVAKVALADHLGKKPVVLVFGSFT